MPFGRSAIPLEASSDDLRPRPPVRAAASSGAGGTPPGGVPALASLRIEFVPGSLTR